MKSMKIRKLAALGVAAAMAAMPVAFAATHYDTLPKNRDWYLQSKIVVGANAATSDVVSAADIAAAVATLAYKKAEISGGVEDATVKLKVSGQIVVGDNGYAKETQLQFDQSNDPGSVTVGKVEVPQFVKEDIKYTYKNADGDTVEETVTAAEKVSYTGNFKLYKDSGADEAYPVLEVSSVSYEVDFTPGIPKLSDKNEVKDLEVPFLGGKYTITEVDPSTKSVTFITAGEEKTLNVGDEIEFQGHKVKLVDIADDGSSVLVSVDGGDPVQINKSSDETVNGIKIYVKSVFNGANIDSATLRLGAEEKTYTDGDLWQDMSDWKFRVFVSGDKVTGIGVEYQGSPLTGSDALKEGDAFKIAGSNYAVKFYGHDDYAKKEIDFSGSYMKIYGATSGRDYQLVYRRKAAVATPAQGSAPDNGAEYNVTTFTMTLGDISVQMEVNAISEDTNTASGSTSAKDHYKVKILKYKLPGMSDYEDYAGQYLSLSSTDIDVTSSVGTADLTVNINRSTANTDEVKYTLKFPQFTGGAVDVVAVLSGITSTDDEKFISDDREVNVALEDNPVDTYNYIYDVELGNDNVVAVPVYMKGDTVELNVDDLGVGFDYDGTYTDWSTDLDEKFKPDAYKEFYTENYDKVELSDSEVKIYVPVKVEKAYPWAGILGEESEQENVYDVKKGESISVGDYEVTVEDITGVVSGGDYYEKVSMPEGWPVGFAVLDNEASSSDNLIVVGGWNANEIAKKIKEKYPEIEQELANDKEIIGLYTVEGQEMVLVAGWEAQDTRQAAADFINWLKQNIE